MPAEGFGPFFEIFSEGVIMTVSTITTASFAERCLKRQVPLNVTGFLASIIALFYSIFGLTYWFNGIQGYSCTALAVVNGTCMSASNALTFLHLFIKANASNQHSARWRDCWAWVGAGTTLLNWATLIVVHALLSGTEIDGLDGPRCEFTFDITSLTFKWLGQFVNQVFQVIAFVYPLVQHMKIMGSSPQKSNDEATIFYRLVVRAVVASAVSLVFTVIVTFLAFLEMSDMAAGTDKYTIPLFPLAVLDNAVNLGAIFFAINVNKHSSEQEGTASHLKDTCDAHIGHVLPPTTAGDLEPSSISPTRFEV